MDKLILAATICGAEITKEQNPAVPYTIDEIVHEAKSAYDAGAVVIHVYVCEDGSTPTQSKTHFRETLDAIYKVIPNVIIIPSTGGAVGMTTEECLQPTELMSEMTALDYGTCNFGDSVSENTVPIMRAFDKCMIENKIKPEYECFEMDHPDTTLRLAQGGGVPGDPMQFNFVLGIFGCTPATTDNLAQLVNNIPTDSTWTTTGVGRHEFPLAAAAIGMGGHVRVGFRGNLYLSKGVPAKSNGELVARATHIAHELGREVASPAEVRQIPPLAPRH